LFGWCASLDSREALLPQPAPHPFVSGCTKRRRVCLLRGLGDVGLPCVEQAECEPVLTRAGGRDSELPDDLPGHDAVLVFAEYFLQFLHPSGQAYGGLAEHQSNRFGGVAGPLGCLAHVVQAHRAVGGGLGLFRRGGGAVNPAAGASYQARQLAASWPPGPIGERRVRDEVIEFVEQSQVAVLVQT
jgi:hypothetical protein